MFFQISKLVAPLLSPLPVFFFAALAVAVLGCRGHARRLLLALLAFLWLCSADAVVDPLLGAWERASPPLALADVPQADAVVVLAGMTEARPAHGLADRVEFESSVERVLEGARLLRAGKAPRLVLSGGPADLFGRQPPEAPRLAAWLTQMQLVEPERIVVEDQSRTTSENAERTAALAREAGWKRLILVTSALHMPRALGCFRAVGLDVVPYPVDYLADAGHIGAADFVPGEKGLLHSRRLGRELIGLAAYTLMGRL
jgi:uncharacterized SAM-binding protein YcdF (DUF218 family)